MATRTSSPRAAERGIGLEQRPWLVSSRSKVELDVMRRIKSALDPTGILNPGRVPPE